MLSLILYGRNDNHGYNLHKRAAISLNAMSEVLTDPDDEILFVDYNTPDDLPSFPEAIADTLTNRTREKLRVLRARPNVHALFRSKTHLMALESVSRNIALRRSNPNNKWILSTNTDMIFVPHAAQESLTDIVRGLPDGFYQLPRFELPEVLWESFDRRDGPGMIARTREWARRFHLNEIVYGSPEILFDGPGDFQLCLRSDLFGIHGFHEGMLRGWHVDANLCARMRIIYGGIEGLTDKLYAYHCDHTRQATAAHRHDRVENDPEEFIKVVDDPQLPGQADNWGLPDETIEEIRLGRADVFSRYLEALSTAIPDEQDEVYKSAYREDSYGGLTYRRAHVLPFVIDLVAPFSRASRVLYVGARDDMFADFLCAYAAMGGQPVLVPSEMKWLGGEAVDRRPLMEALEDADLLVFEFGAGEKPGQYNDAVMRERLSAVRRALIAAGSAEQTRVGQRGLARRRVIAINAIHNDFESLIINYLAFTLTPFSSRVRHGYFLLEALAGQEQSFDVRSVWRDVQKETDRKRSFPLWETQEYTKFATQAAANPDDPLSSEILACAEYIIPFLRHDKIAQASGLVREDAIALADRLEKARPAKHVRALLDRHGLLEKGRDSSRSSRVADSSDWEKASFARFVDHHFGGSRAYGFPDRNLWTWERAAILDVLQHEGALTPKSKVLLVTTVPDALAPALADYVGRVEIARPSPSHGRRFLSARDPQQEDAQSFEAALPFWDPRADQHDFDAVVFAQDCVMAHGPAQVATALSEAAALLKIGGIVVLSCQCALVGDANSNEFAAAPMVDGRFSEDLENTRSSLQFCGPLESRLTVASCDRVVSHRRADLRYRTLLNASHGHVATTAVLTLRRIDVPAGEGGERDVEIDPAGGAVQVLNRSPVEHMDNAALARVIASDIADLAKWRYLEFLNRLRSRALSLLVRSPAIRRALSKVRFRAKMYMLRPELTWRGQPSEWAEHLVFRPGVRHKDGVFEAAGFQPDGHSIYGPYLPLAPGQWALRFKAQVEGGRLPDDALMVDVTQANAPIAFRRYTAAELDGRDHVVRFTTISDFLYDIGRDIDLVKVETRFAPRGGAALRLWDVRLEPAGE